MDATTSLGAVSDSDFREVVRPLTTALGDFAEGLSDQSARHGYLPAHDSPAMVEL
jgi:hypothetical protein